MNCDRAKEEIGHFKLLFTEVSVIFVPFSVWIYGNFAFNLGNIFFPIICIFSCINFMINYACIKSFAGIMQKFTILDFFLFVSLLCNSFVELCRGDGKTKKHI